MSREAIVGKGTAAGRRLVLLVDDHPILREGLAQLLSSAPDLAVCGQAASAAEALTEIEHKRPDVAVVDIFLNGSNGIELTKTIRKRWPQTQVLILSMHDESLYARRALRAGASGYVMKQEVSQTVLAAVRSVLRGERYLSRRLLNDAPDMETETGDPALAEELSDREIEIFELIGNGLARAEIAKRLNLSVKTVEAHRQNIRSKLAIRDAADLVRHAALWVERGRGAPR
jgi:DNA-binding NarL/FixJ family response regulator